MVERVLGDVGLCERRPGLDLRRYLLLTWKWAWLLALCALLGGAAAYYTSIRATPMYEATLAFVGGGPVGPETMMKFGAALARS